MSGTTKRLKVDDEWRTSELAIDEEHERFFELARRLVAVVRNSGDQGLILQALATLQQRFRLHVMAEEEHAQARDPESAAILKEDHQRLLESLGDLRGLVGRVSKAALVERVEAMADEIKRHESEVDVPLFRLMASRGA
jgi:hemerythrin